MPIINPLTYNIANGQAVDAVPLMADLNQIVSNVNANAAALAGSSSQVFNVANATTSGQAASLGQVQAGSANYAVDTGTTANAYVVSLTPAIPATIPDGFRVNMYVTPARVNTDAATLNGVAIVDRNGNPILGGQIKGMCAMEYSTAYAKWMFTGAKQEISVLDFGADPTGVADSSSALNSALAALGSHGGVISMPSGTYTMNSAITFNYPASNFSLVLKGDGQSATTLNWPNASGGMTFNLSNVAHFFCMHDLSLTTSQSGSGTALTFTQSSPLGSFRTSKIERCTISGATVGTNYWSQCATVTNMSGTSWDSNSFYGAGVSGNGITFQGTGAVSSDYSIYHNISKSIFNQLNVGVEMGNYSQGITISQSNFQNGFVGVQSYSGGTGLNQIMILESQFAPASNGGNAINLQGPLSNATLLGNLIMPVGANSGILLGSVTYANISKNIINGPSGNTTYGIVTAGSYNSIKDNIISLCNTAIALQSGSSNCVSENNEFNGNTTNISNSGTSNKIYRDAQAAPVNITPGASPWTYTAGASPEAHYIFGGATSSIAASNGVYYGIATPCQVRLKPYESYTVTYTTAPNVSKEVF